MAQTPAEKPQTLMAACREAIKELGTDTTIQDVKDLFKRKWPQFDTTSTTFPSSVTQARQEARGSRPGPKGAVVAPAPAAVGGGVKKKAGRRPGRPSAAAASARLASISPTPARSAPGQVMLEAQLKQLASLIGPDQAVRVAEGLIRS
jgi:hypothetical protein